MRPDLQVKLADGTDVGYAEAGDRDGYPVLHLHGSPSSRLEVSFPAFLQAAEDLGIRTVAPDRPGMGLSTFRRFSILDYARLVGSFADALGLERFAVTGLSGGGKYACACAWGLPERVTRVALVSSTCSFDLPETELDRSLPTGKSWPRSRSDARGPAMGCAARQDPSGNRDLARRRRPCRFPAPEPNPRRRSPACQNSLRARGGSLVARRQLRQRHPAVRHQRLTPITTRPYTSSGG